MPRCKKVISNPNNLLGLPKDYCHCLSLDLEIFSIWVRKQKWILSCPVLFFQDISTLCLFFPPRVYFFLCLSLTFQEISQKMEAMGTGFPRTWISHLLRWWTFLWNIVTKRNTAASYLQVRGTCVADRMSSLTQEWGTEMPVASQASGLGT